MLELAVAELAASPNVQLSLNISPDTTMDPDWWTSIESLMRAHPGVAERLIVEITETVAIQDIDDVRGFVTRLKNFGSRIAIDDFGAGYTSFRNLRKLGVDIVKIDGAFVQNIARSADDRAFVQTLIDLARRLQIKTVAEWVQDEEVRRHAARMGLRLHPGPPDRPCFTATPFAQHDGGTLRPAPHSATVLICNRRARSISVCTRALCVRRTRDMLHEGAVEFSRCPRPGALRGHV